MTDLASVDLIVIVLYFLIILAIGIWSGRGERNAEDYFLAGRALPWYLIGFSFFASNMSGASFVGLMGAAYQHGITVFNYEWTAALVLIVFAVFMAPVFLRARIFTVPEYLELRFDRRARWAYAGFTILTLLFIDMAGALYAGGIVVSTMFPQVDLWGTSAALALFAGAYTLIGGLRAVVITDALQAVLMIVGASLIFFFGLEKVGGWEALMSSLDAAQTTLMRPADDDFLPWPGIMGVVLLGFYYWTLNQYFVQRALAARNLDQARKGALFGGLLKLPNVFLMILPGMIALALMPGLDNPDRVFPMLAFELLPTGLKGLLLVALVAAVMSSLDSALNAAASLLTMDFVRPLRPQTSGRTLLVVGRIFTALLIAFAACYAPLIERFGSLFQYFQSTLAYLVPPIVAVYLIGLFWRRGTAAGGFWAIVAGLAIGLILFLAKEVTGLWTGIGLPTVHFTYMAMLMFTFSSIVLISVSLLDGRSTGNSMEACYRANDWKPDLPSIWYRDYRTHAIALAVLLAGFLFAFW